jgi:copper resistance protein B
MRIIEFKRSQIVRGIIAAVVSVVFASAAFAQHDMSSMPGMSHGQSLPAGKAGGSKAKPTADGLDPAKKISADAGQRPNGGMEGMAMPNEGGAQETSEPRIRVLGPSEPWHPPKGHDRAAELLSKPMLDAHLKALPDPIEDSKLHSFVLAEILEFRANSSGPNTFRWDIYGWVGGDYNRLWVKTEGSQSMGGQKSGEGDLQLLYGRLIAPFWDFQVGARVQRSLGTGSRDSRTYAAIGVQGLAPYLFDVEPTLFISDRGDVSARLTVSFDLLLTQKLVLQPRFEANAAFSSDEKLGVGEGLNDTDVGLRLRYEIRREFAPYIGFSWLRRYGETAQFAEREGEGREIFAFVAGVRVWF